MTYSINTNNMLELQGNIVRVQKFSASKTSTITLAVTNGQGNGDGRKRGRSSYIQLKTFSPALYNTVKVGMNVRVYGSIQTSRYERNGETVYSTSLVAEYIDVLPLTPGAAAV